ncbi:uncharacterized mitochondrial protein-like protein [Tanacetum coccineum]
MMLEKEKQVDTTPIDYVALNKDFLTRFVPQTELFAEQAFWSKNSVNSPKPTLSIRPTNVEVPKELPKVSMEEATLLRDLVDHSKANYPLDPLLKYAYLSGDLLSETFTIVGNACPLTRISQQLPKCPLGNQSAQDHTTPKPGVTIVYSRKPRSLKLVFNVVDGISQILHLVLNHPTPELFCFQVIALVLANSTGLPSLTTVDQDAPSPSNYQTTPKTEPLVIPNDVEEDNHDIEVAHTGNDPKWTKDHLLENIIGELAKPVSTRLQLHEQALFYYYDAFLTAVEPKTYKDALTQACWIEAMQEELKEFERLKNKSDIVARDTVKRGIDLEDLCSCEIKANGLFINQSKYALESLKKYGFDSCDPVDTPMVEKSKLDEDKEVKAKDPSHYRSMIGTLVILQPVTYLPLVNMHSVPRYQHRALRKALNAVKKIFRLSKRTVHRGLDPPEPEGSTPQICAKIYDETDFKEKLNKIVWNMYIGPEEFEYRWGKLMEEFKLENHKWLTKMFNIRSTWIPTYFIDSPLCGLMRTTSRSESENSFFSYFTNSGLTLTNFMNYFEMAMEKQRHVQERMDHKTTNTVPKLKTLLKIERHAFNNANVEMIPQQYILRRWTKNLIPAALLNKRNRYGEKNVAVENYANEKTSIVDHWMHIVE